MEDLRIGSVEGDPRYVFGAISDVLPGADGRIWVLDAQASVLRLYDVDATFLLELGGPGGGPGEFDGGYPCAIAGRDGDVWVEDRGGRWHHFAGDGTLLSSERSGRRLICGIWRWTSRGIVVVDGGFNEEARRMEQFLVLYAEAPEDRVLAVDTFPLPPLPLPPTVTWVTADGRTTSTLPIPLTHLPRWVIGAASEMWVTDGSVATSPAVGLASTSSRRRGRTSARHGCPTTSIGC